MFQWDTPKVEPSEQDMLILLNKQYSLRLDLERKLVEHVTTFKGSDQSHMVDDDDDAELDRLLHNMEESGELVDKSVDQESSSKKLKTQ